MTRLQVNGADHEVETHASAALVWALRDELGCSSVKYGCGTEHCGACRVLVDGALAYSCTMTIGEAEGRTVTTLEAFVADGRARSIIDAMASIDAGQCGYCLPGVVTTLTALSIRAGQPTRADVVGALERHLCRCGSHSRILDAAYAALGVTDG